MDILTCTGKQNFRLESKELWEVQFQPRPELEQGGCKLSEKEIRSAQRETTQRVKHEEARKFVQKDVEMI